MKVEIPDELGITLQTKAAAQDLSIEDWVRKLAEPEAKKALTSQQAAARILEIQKRSKPDPEGWTVQDYINHGRP